MTIEHWFALAAASFAASVAPGQNVALVGGAAVRVGPIGGIGAAAGILVAELAWSVLALTLLLGACEVNPELYTGLEVASAISLAAIGFSSCARPYRIGRPGLWPGAACGGLWSAAS